MCRTLNGRGTTFAYPIILRSINSVDDDSLQAISFIARSGDPPVSDECVDVLLQVICLGLAPPCNPETGLPVLICERSCRVYEQIVVPDICSVLLVRVQELVAVTPSSETFQGIINAFYNFDCKDPTTYFFMNVTQPDPTICINLLPAEKESKYP